MANYRVVTYARVSTKSQRDRGKSLDDQEARFKHWLQETGHERVAKYEEAVSGRAVDKRKTLQRMLDELPRYRPDFVVVDSLDRWTRNIQDGYEMLGGLQKQGVQLWELDYEENRPLDIRSKKTDDWRYVHQKFGDAEAESRRTGRRQDKRYQAQRERGATTTNRPPFGLKLGGPKGDKRLVRDPDTAWVIEEVDRLALGGQSQRSILAALRAKKIDAWTSRRGLSGALLNESYVRAGVRSEETEKQLLEISRSRQPRFGSQRMQPNHADNRHLLSGIFACGYCVKEDRKTGDSLMYSRFIQANNAASLVCDGRREKIHPPFYVSVKRIAPYLAGYAEALLGAAELNELWDSWMELRTSPRSKQTRTLSQQRESLLAEEARIERRRERIAKMLDADGDEGEIIEEARTLLQQSTAQWTELRAQREKIEHFLAQTALPVDEPKERAAARDMIAQLEKVWAFAPTVLNRDDPQNVDDAFDEHDLWHFGQELRHVLKLWTALLGHPIIERPARKSQPNWRSQLRVKWQRVDYILNKTRTRLRAKRISVPQTAA